MNKKIVSLLCSLFLLSGCSGLFESGKTDDISSVTDDEGKISEPLDINTDVLNNPNTKYDPSVLLVKTSATSDSDVLTDDMRDLGIESIKSIAPRSEWKKATLKEGIDALSVIKKFRNSGLFDMVDFDYIYDTEEVKEETTVTTSTIPTEIADYQKQVNVDKAWKYLEDNGKDAGGDSSVIVAVIDTGVDYNHIDLKQNIWINKGEIPGNGIDDDNNGYVDDVYGWNFVGDNNDPMDDNGHGTHVAGIIGAANNDIGVTGVAYNCKVMPIKAGNSSGYFNNSDIASAITYAYMNGADVINMSFGGTSVTMAVQEALEKAYSTSFLVAAAGNDACQNEYCVKYPTIPVETEYPASFSFVNGVMSVNGSNYGSVFTNFDPIKENKIEYECFAPGEYISSTFPGNRYASLSGTSMAAPVVSGIAALLRSAVPNKNDFPSKFLMSQIINTSETQPIFKYWNGKAMVVDAYKALTAAPKPDVSLYDWYTFDNKSISSKNNGDDNIDAGETVHIGVELMNRGGMAKDVTATIDVKRLADDIVDPYVTITTPTVKFSDIGTYSVRDAGKKMESDTVVDVEKPFVFDVAENVPNNYQCDINIYVTWKNGLDSKDTTLYSFDSVMSVTFHRGEVLPARIDTDTTLTADKLWIVNDTVRIGEGVTVTVEPGTNIQFYEQNQSKYQYATPKILLAEGASFICNGTEDKMINIYPADGYENYIVQFCYEKNALYAKESVLLLNYVKILNIKSLQRAYDNQKINITYSILDFVSESGVVYEIKDGETLQDSSQNISATRVEKTIINCWHNGYFSIVCDYCSDSVFIFDNVFSLYMYIYKKCESNVFFFNSSLSNSDISIGVSRYYCNYDSHWDSSFSENVLVNDTIDNDVLSDYCKITFNYECNDIIPQLINNHFYGYPKPIGDRIIDSRLTNVVSGTGSVSSVWPFVSGYQFTNDKGEETTKFSKENMNLKLYFNRAMDTTDPLFVRFGSVEPYADYIIDGTWVDEYTWQGKREIPTAIENGTQHLTVSGGRAKDDHFLTNNDNCRRISFDIDTTSAMAMNMFATPTKDGIQLEMKQDDYDTVMGYNVYRSETKDGEYARINTSVIRPEDAEQNATYLDTTVEPGKTYYYSYTAVMTDFSESHASGRTACTALDTINPIISHTPVNQGYLGSNLNINCVIRDNVSIAYAKLYYRVKGSEAYKYVDMVSANDKYSAVIPAAELSTDGMEYYIETNDGTNTITLGTKESPYQVTIKESSAVSYLGDVDGNGIIEAADAMLVLQHINGKRVLVNDEFRRADLNGNGTLESFEALAILQYVNGNRTNLEV